MKRFLAIVTGVTLTVAFGAGAAVTVTPIPFQPEVLAGNATIAYGTPGPVLMKWTPDGGAVQVASFAGLSGNGVTLTSVSDDGAVVAGWFQSLVGRAPFIWTAAGGFQTFPAVAGGAPPRVFVSGDGNVVVTDGSRLLPAPATAFNYSPRSINYDGSVIGVTGTEGFAARMVSGVRQFIKIPGDETPTRVQAITPDGSVSAGTTNNVTFVWRGSQVDTFTSPYEWQVSDISADGRVIVGNSVLFADTATLMIDGQRYLVEDYLAAHGASTTIERYDYAWGVSNDGTQFVLGGIGSNTPQGALVTIPEPAAALLALLSAPALLNRRRRRTCEAPRR